MAKIKTVSLVGAGPGNPELITLAAIKVLQKAEVVIYDGLVNPSLLEYAPDARQIDVSKAHDPFKALRSKSRLTSQSNIHSLLLRYTRQGKKVVRLKGGDPFIFGRGGEEAEYLKAHKIPFEVVPGVSAASAVPAFAGIPITDRRFASSVLFATSHEDPTKKETSLDWELLARHRGTLVFFMGVKAFPKIKKRLLELGKKKSTPVALIEWGSVPRQKVVEGTFANIDERLKKDPIHSPALIVIGEVVRLRKKIAWFEKRALYGKKIMITRAKHQVSVLKERLEELGAEVYEMPTIEITEPLQWKRVDQSIRDQVGDGVLFTSPNSVNAFLSRLLKKGKDARWFAGKKIVAMGPKTAEVLKCFGLKADLVPESYHSQGALKSLVKKKWLKNKTWILSRTNIAPSELPEQMEVNGAKVLDLTTYRTIAAPKPPRYVLEALKKKEVDAVLFTSASTVEHFMQRVKPLKLKKLPTLFSIGPMTSKAIRKAGKKPKAEAKEHTLDGLVRALIKAEG